MACLLAGEGFWTPPSSRGLLVSIPLRRLVLSCGTLVGRLGAARGAAIPRVVRNERRLVGTLHPFLAIGTSGPASTSAKGYSETSGDGNMDEDLKNADSGDGDEAGHVSNEHVEGRVKQSCASSAEGASSSRQQLRQKCPLKVDSEDILHCQLNPAQHHNRRDILRFFACATIPALLFPLNSSVSLGAQLSTAPIRHLENNFGVQVLLATEEALVETGKISQYDLQKEFFKLRQQEFAPLRKANFGGLRALGQELNVNDVPYFNFQSYIQWKIVARKLRKEDERQAFNLAVGRKLLRKLFPDGPEFVQANCPVSVASLPVPPAMLGLQPEERSEIIWSLKQNTQTGSTGSDFRLWESAVSGGVGAVCLRGVEAAVEGLLTMLRDINFIEGYSTVWTDVGDRSASVRVKLKAPADLEGGVLIRAEDNFWQRVTSSMLSALFEQLKIRTSVDEYFSREFYKPKTLLEQAVLALGDPLVPIIDPVEVDQVVETWHISWG